MAGRELLDADAFTACPVLIVDRLLFETVRLIDSLSAALSPVFARREKLRVILDAGGGTGLLGPHLRDHCRQLWNCVSGG